MHRIPSDHSQRLCFSFLAGTKGNKKEMQSQSADTRENFLAAVEGMGL